MRFVLMCLVMLICALSSVPPADAQFIRIAEVADTVGFPSTKHFKATRYSAAGNVSDCSAISTWKVSNNVSYRIQPITAKPRGREIYLIGGEVGATYLIASLKCSSSTVTLVDSFPIASILGLVTKRGDPAMIVTKLDTYTAAGRLVEQGARIQVGNPNMAACSSTAMLCIEMGATVQLCYKAFNKFGAELGNSCTLPQTMQTDWFAYMSVWKQMMTKTGKEVVLMAAGMGPRRECWATVNGGCVHAT